MSPMYPSTLRPETFTRRVCQVPDGVGVLRIHFTDECLPRTNCHSTRLFSSGLARRTLEVIPSDEGSVNGVMRDPTTGFLFGAADPRRFGSEGGWWGPTSFVYAIGW